jgi:hypothetical protein
MEISNKIFIQFYGSLFGKSSMKLLSHYLFALFAVFNFLFSLKKLNADCFYCYCSFDTIQSLTIVWSLWGSGGVVWIRVHLKKIIFGRRFSWSKNDEKVQEIVPKKS